MLVPDRYSDVTIGFWVKKNINCIFCVYQLSVKRVVIDLNLQGKSEVGSVLGYHFIYIELCESMFIYTDTQTHGQNCGI